MLRREPKVFIPRVVTTTLYTVLVFYTARIALESTALLASSLELTGAVAADPILMELIANKLVALVLVSVGVYAIDLLSYAMYPSLVNDCKAGRPVTLIKALLEASRSWRVLAWFGLITLVFILFLSMPAVVLYTMTLLSGELIYLALMAVLALAAILFFAVAFFFVIPIAVLDRKNTLDSVLAGVRLSWRHKGDVTKTNLLFLVLGTVTIAVATLTEFKGTVGYAAMALFLLGRLIQAVGYTYMCIVNPALYLQLKEDKST